jgi:hypothetical protein
MISGCKGISLIIEERVERIKKSINIVQPENIHFWMKGIAVLLRLCNIYRVNHDHHKVKRRN